MSVISTFLLGFVRSRIEKQYLDAFFTVGLVDRLQKSADKWRDQLPAGHELHAIESLFVTEVVAVDSPFRQPANIIQKLKHNSLPTVVDWYECFKEQWHNVHSTHPDPAPFFCLTAVEVEPHLRELAYLVYNESIKDQALFQAESLRILQTLNREIESFGDLKRELQDLTYGVRLQLENARSDGSSSTFHGDIELAGEHRKHNCPDLAIAKLTELKDRHWDSLSPREKYRILANRGLAYQDKEQLNDAARDFIACKEYQPTDEKARVFEATGYAMQGDATKSHAMARQILVTFPNSAMAFALLVNTAPDDTAFDKIEALVPEALRDTAEVSLALSIRAASGRLLDTAERYSRQVLALDGDNPVAQSFLGCLLVDSTITRIAPLLSDSPPVDSERLTDARQLLEKAKTCFAAAGASEAKAKCHYFLGRVFDLLGNSSESERQLSAAYESDPKEPRYAISLAIELEGDHPEQALQLLNEAIDKDETLSVAIMLAQRTDRRNGVDSVAEAIALLEKHLHRFPGPSATANSEFIDTLARLYQKANRGQDADALLNNEGQRLGEVERLTLFSAIEWRKGEKETAKKLIRDAIAALSQDTDNWHRHLIARELLQQTLFADALTLLKSYVPNNCLSVDTRNLIACAQKCEDIEFLIGFLDSLRTAGVFDTGFIELELNLLERYHAGEKSIAIAESLLAANAGDDEFRRELKVRLNFLGIAYDRPDLLCETIDELPVAAAARPYYGFLVVQFLSRQHRHSEAQEYAYTLLRSQFDNPWSHKALIYAYLLGRRETAYVRPETVQPGTAFRFRDDITGVEGSVVLEDGPKPMSGQDEYPPTHHIFSKAIGRKVGETFPLRSDPIQPKTGTILQIDDTKVYRFNRCMNEWESRFQEFFLVAMTMPRDEKGELDVSTMVKFARDRQAEMDRRDDIYRNNPFSLTCYAGILQKDIVDVVVHLASRELPVRCCTGTDAEQAGALRLLEHAPTLVIDPSAVATLLITRSYRFLDSIKAAGVNLLVPRGVLIRLRSRIEEDLKFSGSGAMPAENAQIIVEDSNKGLQQWVQDLEGLIESLKRCSKVIDGLSLAKMSPTLRDQLVHCFGWDTAEAIALCDETHGGLWTDDYFVAQVAYNEHKTPRVWTELILRWATHKGTVTRAESLPVLSDLIRFGYHHTQLAPELAVKMGEDSQWDYRVEPFKSAIKWLETAGVRRSAIGAVAEELLPRIYRGQNELIDNVTVLRILSSIGNRRDGIAIVRELRRRIGLVCGTDFIAADRLATDIDTWLEHSKKIE